MDDPNRRNHLSVERIFNLIALVSSLAALYFAWESNQVTKQLATPHVFVTGLEPDFLSYYNTFYVPDPSGSFFPTSEFTNFFCSHGIRFVNLGGAPTSVLGYEATLSFDGVVVGVSSNAKEAWIQASRFSWNPLVPQDLLTPQLFSFEGVLFSEGQQSSLIELPLVQFPQESPPYSIDNTIPSLFLPSPVSFPYSIDAFSTQDLQSRLHFRFDFDFEDDAVNGFSVGGKQLKIIYTFQLSTGETVTSTPIECNNFPWVENQG